MRPSNFNQSRLLDAAALANLFRNALALRYHLLQDRFEGCIPGEPSVTVLSPSRVLAIVANTLAQQPDRFPPHRLSPRWLKSFLVRLKALCACPDDDLQVLDQFVASRLTLQPGCDVTSAELCEAYQSFMCAHGGSALSTYAFHRQLPAVIKDTFGIAKRHEILRPDPSGRQTKRNGWRGLKLTGENDATDSTDTNDGIARNVPNTGTDANL